MGGGEWGPVDDILILTINQFLSPKPIAGKLITTTIVFPSNKKYS